MLSDGDFSMVTFCKERLLQACRAPLLKFDVPTSQREVEGA